MSTFPLSHLNGSRYRILICHPERQHSHELAVALQDSGHLAAYVHGAPLPESARRSIPAARRSRSAVFRLGRQLLRPLLAARANQYAFYRLLWTYDALIAKRLGALQADAVVAYENSALRTFREAKRRGMACILDHAGVHHALQDCEGRYSEKEVFHRRVIRRKDEELALADLVLVCSSFAAESFVAGGVPRDKLKIVQPGCDVSAFRPCARGDARSAQGPIHFLFVGRLNYLKGADLLADAAFRLREENIQMRITVVAALGEADDGLVDRFTGLATLKGKVPHEALAAVHAEADCLVLPSRFDSFGFVVAEALASGLPVIVSDHVGAKDMITEGDNGWIVPSGDVESLSARMRWCATNVGKVRMMGAAARAVAEAWDWERYRSQALSTLDTFMAERYVRRCPL